MASTPRPYFDPGLGRMVYPNGVVDTKTPNPATTAVRNAPSQGRGGGAVGDTAASGKRAGVKPSHPASVAANPSSDYVSPFATTAGGFGLSQDAAQAVGSQENIIQMQRFLQHQGYDIPLSGALDPVTKAAVADWHGPRNPKMWSATQTSARTTAGATDQGGMVQTSALTPPPVVTPTVDTTAAMQWLQGLLKGGVGGPSLPALPGYANPNQLVLPGAPKLPGLNLPDFPNLPTLPNSQVDPHLIDPKQAAAIAQAAYKVPIQQTQRDITQQQGQGSQDITDIQNWFNSAMAQNKSATTDSDAFLKQILGDSDAAAQGIASSLDDPAAAAQAAKTAAISRGMLGATGTAEHDYQGQLGSSLALQGATELTDQKRINAAALAALQGKLSDLQTQGGVDAATANFNAGVSNNGTLASTEDRNYQRTADAVGMRRQNALDRFSAGTNAAQAEYGANRANILDTYGANRQNAVDGYNADTENYDKGYQAQVSNLKDTYQMALQGDASALNKLTVMAMLPGQLQGQAQQLVSGMQGIQGNAVNNAAATWAYQHPKAATAGFNLADASQQTGLRNSLVGLIANGKTGKIALRPAVAANKLKTYLQGFGLDQDPVAIRLAQSALQSVLDNGGYNGVKVSPYGIGVYGRVATKKK